MKLWSTTGTVLRDSSFMNVSASMNSFQPSRKHSTAVVASPGAASGSITRHIAPSRVAPSVRAACSSSAGIPTRNPRITHMASGTVNAR